MSQSMQSNEEPITIRLINFYNLIHFEPEFNKKQSYYHLEYTGQEFISDAGPCHNISEKQSAEVWSIGVILHILLTGEYVHGGDSDKDVIERIASFELDFFPFLN
mmetsp:Transcript_8121/g.6056  ORF Transcript_8121/g.6056 Transcript_8121/m.6056 type:complete len:105 (-) Transcript_8121:512-826(-)